MAARDVKRSKEYWALLNAAADRQASGQPFDKAAANAFSDWLAEYSPHDARHVLLANATAHSPVQGGAPREHPTLGRALQGDDIGAVTADDNARGYYRAPVLSASNGIASHEGEVRLLSHTRRTAGWRTDSAPVLWWRAKIPAAASTLKREANDATRSSVLAGPVGTPLARSVDFTAPVSAETLHGYIAAMPKSATRARWQAAANAMYGKPLAPQITRDARSLSRAADPYIADTTARYAEEFAREGKNKAAAREHKNAAIFHEHAARIGKPNPDAHLAAAEAHRAAAESYTKRKLERDARRLSYERERLARVRYNSQASGVSEKLSDNHAARISLAKRILRETGLRATVRSVLSHTDERGVRPGVAALVHADTPDDILHYATAWLGMLTGERRMTTFKPGVGSDSLHIITTPRSQTDTGEYLKRLGAQFTLDTSGKGTRALLVNPTIDTSAASSGLQGSRQVLPGTAKMLGSGDEGESRARYRNIISAAEHRAGVTAGPTSPL